jgi:hypothetical protein
VFYVLGRGKIPADEPGVALDRDLSASLHKVYGCDHWRCVPHVSTEEISAGYHTTLERLQGARQTWYTGELPAFPTVEHVAAYSRRLVAAYF